MSLSYDVFAESDSKTGSSISTEGGSGIAAVAVFAGSGRAVVVGQSKGTLLVLDRNSMGVLDVVRVRDGDRQHVTCSHSMFPSHLRVDIPIEGDRVFLWLLCVPYAAC